MKKRYPYGPVGRSRDEGVQIEQEQAGDGPRVARESKKVHACLVVPNHDRAIVRSRRDSVRNNVEE